MLLLNRVTTFCEGIAAGITEKPHSWLSFFFMKIYFSVISFIPTGAYGVV